MIMSENISEKSHSEMIERGKSLRSSLEAQMGRQGAIVHVRRKVTEDLLAQDFLLVLVADIMGLSRQWVQYYRKEGWK